MLSRIGKLAALGLPAVLAFSRPSVAQEVSGPLVVYNAGSLAVPFKRLLDAFVQRHPQVDVRQEHSGSLAAVRKLTELGRIPDVIALADWSLFPSLLEPEFTDWYAVFARNSMVLAMSPRLDAADRANGTSWPDVLLRDDVRWGRADPGVDPAGYRALMVFQLAERHLGRPGLADSLLARSEERFVRPKSADLVALVQLGELNYAWLYASLARFHQLPFVELAPAVNLGSAAHVETYGEAAVTVPGRSGASDDRVVVTGKPIEYGVSVPIDAPNRTAAMAFYRFLTSETGRSLISDTGLAADFEPVVSGNYPDD